MFISIEVQIGFEEIMYAVNERDRQVVVGVVLDGDISENVRVRLGTTDGTATSTCEYASVNMMHSISVSTAHQCYLFTMCIPRALT